MFFLYLCQGLRMSYLVIIFHYFNFCNNKLLHNLMQTDTFVFRSFFKYGLIIFISITASQHYNKKWMNNVSCPQSAFARCLAFT